MSCRPLAVENPALREERDAGADTSNIGAAVVPLLEPRQERCVLCNRIIASQPDAGIIMMSAFLISLSAPSGVSPKAQTDFTPRPSIEAVRTLNSRFYGLSMQPVPYNTSSMKYFDGSNCCRRIAPLENDDDDVQEIVTASAGSTRAARSCHSFFSHAHSPSCSTRSVATDQPMHRPNPR